MKLPALYVAAAAAAVLAASASPSFGAPRQTGAPAAQDHKVKVIAGKYVVVDQQPLVVLRTDTAGKIIWELPPKPSPYRFGEDGIAIDFDQFLGCHYFAGGLKYECTARMPRTHKLYPYRITVHGPDKDAEPLVADGSVQLD